MSKVQLRFIVDYQMMGDMEGIPWSHLVLATARDQGLIDDFNALASLRGEWGLQYVVFTIDVTYDLVDLEGKSREEVVDMGTALANQIVGDSDATARWVENRTA